MYFFVFDGYINIARLKCTFYIYIIFYCIGIFSYDLIFWICKCDASALCLIFQLRCGGPRLKSSGAYPHAFGKTCALHQRALQLSVWVPWYCFATIIIYSSEYLHYIYKFIQNGNSVRVNLHVYIYALLVL